MFIPERSFGWLGVDTRGEFEFDYLFCCFFDTNGKAFPNNDNHMLSVMCGLAALHEAVALG